MKQNLILILIALLFSGCVEPEENETRSKIEAVQNLDERADRIVQWRVRDSDTTFWFERGFEIKNRTGTIGGRASRNILSVESKFQFGEPLTAKIVSPRKFVLQLNEEQIVNAAAGNAIVTTVHTSVGRRHVFTRFSPRLNQFKGDHRIYILTAINAVYVGDKLTFRGRVNTAAGWELTDVRSPQKEATLSSQPSLHPFDFDAQSIAEILSDSVHLTLNAHDGARQYITKSANFGLRLIKLGTADLPPSQVWPRQTCHPEVHACLRNYKGDDFEICGYANQISACWGPHAIDFSQRLKEEINHLYETNSRLISAQHGRSRKTALARISPNKVGYVDPSESEDDAVNTDDILVYHPGVIYRRSSILWQGHYDKSGDFQFIEKLN